MIILLRSWSPLLRQTVIDLEFDHLKNRIATLKSLFAILIRIVGVLHELEAFLEIFLGLSATI